MKNIHLLPTDKPSTPSRLFYKDQELVFSKKYSVFNGVNIYITSDEEIKEGDYCIDGNDIYGPFEEGDIATVKFIKIIFTTDEQLIRYGVQAIDDEFLEWFVKNPSCEEVEVNKLCYGALSGFADAGYKIIIPKEEPKQETLEEVGMYQQELFNYLFDLGLVALQSEMQEIERIVLNMQQEQDKNKYSEEDMRKMYDFGSIGHFTENESLEQFKKK